MKHLSFFILSFSFLLISCSNSDNTTTTDDTVDPATIEYSLNWEMDTAPRLPQGMIQDAQNRPYFYLALKSGGVSVYDSSRPELITTVSTSLFGSLHAMNITQQGNYLYIALGNFFGGSSKAGLAIIDVTNPETPIVTDFWATTDVEEGSAVVKVEGNYAFLGAMTRGIYVLDISDKNNILETSQYIPDPNFPIPNPNSVQTPNARGMAIQNNKLYLCYDAGGLRVIDISDPTNLTEIGRFLDETIGTQQAFNNVLINGNTAYIATDYCGMEIVDISDPTNPSRISWLNPWGCETSSNNWFNSDGHMNQIRHDVSSNLLFVSSGKSEIVVVDVTDPSNPFVKSRYGELDNDEGVWGVDLKGNKLYLLYITAIIPFTSNYSGIRCVEWTEN